MRLSSTRERPVRLTERGWRRYRLAVPRSHDEQSFVLLGLISLSVGVLLFTVLEPLWVPTAWFAIPLLLGSLLLTIRSFLGLLLVQAVCIVIVLAITGPSTASVSVVAALVVAAVIMTAAVARSRLGPMGESMLIDLRDRLRSQSELPDLPPDWSVQAVIGSAGGAQFAGDFVVAATTQKGAQLEVVVVDVSGKGLAAGTRALLLSGAFGGLLGALPPGGFLTAANAYLLRQQWTEGFATAAHLALRLDTGTFELRTAGHPPGVQLHAGSGRWEVLTSSGPALGLLDDAEFDGFTGRLSRGDALMIFTDGMVETAERDFTLGIDKLLGEAEVMLRKGDDDVAERLLALGDSTADDRTLLFLHRR
ncbi:MAG: serine/threonine-protein phosphatase [Nocardioidaceae bacterium]|nr:serine/threonine-protein phosphatase [Nocardioidaceae bacterium]